MRRKTFTVNASVGGNSHSGIYVPDVHISPFNVSFGVVVDTTAKFTVQHTFDDVFNSTPTTWFPHEFVVAASANIDGNYAQPVTGIRLEVSGANSGGATITFIQAGIGDG